MCPLLNGGCKKHTHTHTLAVAPFSFIQSRSDALILQLIRLTFCLSFNVQPRLPLTFNLNYCWSRHFVWFVLSPNFGRCWRLLPLLVLCFSLPIFVCVCIALNFRHQFGRNLRSIGGAANRFLYTFQDSARSSFLPLSSEPNSFRTQIAWKHFERMPLTVHSLDPNLVTMMQLWLLCFSFSFSFRFCSFFGFVALSFAFHLQPSRSTHQFPNVANNMATRLVQNGPNIHLQHIRFERQRPVRFVVSKTNHFTKDDDLCFFFFIKWSLWLLQFFHRFLLLFLLAFDCDCFARSNRTRSSRQLDSQHFNFVHLISENHFFVQFLVQFFTCFSLVEPAQYVVSFLSQVVAVTTKQKSINFVISKSNWN